MPNHPPTTIKYNINLLQVVAENYHPTINITFICAILSKKKKNEEVEKEEEEEANM